jgi:hypothetical protein
VFRNLLVLAVLALVGGILYLRLSHHTVSLQQARRETPSGCSQAAVPFHNGTSGLWLVVTGHVFRLLPDSYGRFEHQRFVLRCSSGQTILIENDVSVGHRVPVHHGDVVVVRGQYIWNALGGLIHFTHSGGPGEGGWILYRNKVYS